VIVFADSPAANDTLPDGSTDPAKSAAIAWFPPLPVTAQETLDVTVRSPERVTVNVNGVGSLPVPSAFSADTAAIATVGAGGKSSLRIVPDAAAGVPSVAPLGLESVTVKPSSDSIVASAKTLTVIVLSSQVQKKFISKYLPNLVTERRSEHILPFQKEPQQFLDWFEKYMN
jgi:hypothetical protein